MKKALVVDNNEVILKILSRILQTRGLQVLQAKDGLSALEILKNYHPDFIFTDLIMPNIDGENLCRIVSKKKEFSNTLLIIISAVAVEDVANFQDFGAHVCVAKGPAAEMAQNIDFILSHAEDGKIDRIKGMRLGGENLAPRTIAKELLDAKQHLRLIFDNIDNGIIEFYRSGIVVNCNSYISSLLNKSELDILSSDLHDLFSDPTHQHIHDSLNQFQANYKPVECKHSVKVNNKDIVFKFVSMSSDYNSTSIMILRDISEEHQARQKLKEHLVHLEKLVAERTKSYEEANKELQIQIAEGQKISEELTYVAKQWRNTFDTISDFVSVHDKDMKFIRVNKALAAFFGKKPEDLIGKYCYQVMHGENEPNRSCPHFAAIEQGQAVTYELDDPQIGVPLLITCTPLLHDDGSLLGSVHVARDISEQKKATALREKLIGQLEKSLAKVKLLSGFIPICSSCKKIRDDKGYWKQVEDYIRDHSEAEFSHSICPDCTKKLYPGLIDNND